VTTKGVDPANWIFGGRVTNIMMPVCPVEMAEMEEIGAVLGRAVRASVTAYPQPRPLLTTPISFHPRPVHASLLSSRSLEFYLLLALACSNVTR
jgi:hypothetical protein